MPKKATAPLLASQMSEAFVARFWSHVEKTNTCWLWKLKSVLGYGGVRLNSKTYRPSRVSWVLANGPIPDGMLVCHKCSVRNCVHPSHLFLGNHQDASNETGLGKEIVLALSETDLLRFWNNVDKTGECWLWLGAKDRAGYGSFGWNGKLVKTHRVAYWNANNGIPAGMMVCHHCDNPGCVRPSHLFAGMMSDNSRDMVNKGRSLVGDRNPSRIHRDLIPRGELHWHARLNAELVVEMRKARDVEQLTYAAIAERFGVSLTHAHKVVTRRWWSHVA